MKAKICLDKEQEEFLRKRIRMICEEEHLSVTSEDEIRIIRQMMKLCSLVLNRDFKFGHKRMNKFIVAVTELEKERKKDPEVFWFRKDRELAPLNLGFEPEDYDLMDGKVI